MSMLEQTVYKVAEMYSRFPGGRRRANGDFSGEQFREDVVLPLLSKYKHIIFDLTGSAGYSSGFLDEAFGELGSLMPYEEVRRRIELVASDDPDAVEIAWDRVRDASRERGR
ncbi:STAS-like domain-containing protein [uncultured Stenotrophomonas sp.]|uniref:STAS-like domain-containing protein n=1 Tax=uncultured Stenotrophomonas sp. TaxID=165438 RepID=UPI00258A8116|nr:STAS-like domain-containing protein [uncultured Stenotrophomonas sp.]